MKQNPEHYRRGTIEPWDFIVAQQLGFLEGNIIKYITRAGHKKGESKMDDLTKAATYLRKLIDTTPDEPITSRPDGSSNRIPEGNESTYRNVQPYSSTSSNASDLRRVSGSY